jgi:hypothetical protein
MSVHLIEVSPTNSRVMDQRSVTIPKINDLIIDYLSVFPDGNTDRLKIYIKYYNNKTLKNIINSFYNNPILYYFQSINYQKIENFLTIIVNQINLNEFKPIIEPINAQSNSPINAQSNSPINAQSYSPSNSPSNLSINAEEYIPLSTLSNQYSSSIYNPTIDTKNALSKDRIQKSKNDNNITTTQKRVSWKDINLDISTSPIVCLDKKSIIMDFLNNKFVPFLNNKIDKYGYFPIEYIINKPHLIKHNISLSEFISIIKNAKLNYITISSNNKYIKSTHEKYN